MCPALQYCVDVPGQNGKKCRGVPPCPGDDQLLLEQCECPAASTEPQSVVDANKARFANWPNVTFAQTDLTSYDPARIPNGYDLLFSRDAMMHNTLEDCWHMLDSFTRTDVKYVLLGSYGVDKHGRRSGASQPGKWFAITLDKPPFGMPYIERIPEGNIEGENKYMLLYDRLELRKELVRRGHI